MKQMTGNEYARQIQTRLHQFRQELQNDATAITDPKGQALCETASEVLLGLEKAFEHYENKSEPAWK